MESSEKKEKEKEEKPTQSQRYYEFLEKKKTSTHTAYTICTTTREKIEYIQYKTRLIIAAIVVIGFGFEN